MKIRVDLQGSSKDEAEELLYKALKAKRESEEKFKERYADDAMNEFHDFVMDEHKKHITTLNEKITQLINFYVHRR